MSTTEAATAEAVATPVTATPSANKNVTMDDKTEASLGIAEYMSPITPTHHGFSAVVKARYSDFVVHEVALNGTMARLFNRDLPQTKKEEPTEEPETKEPSATESATAAPTPKDWATLKSELIEMIKDAAVAENVTTMLQAHSDDQESTSKFVTLPELAKPERKAIHGWIRESLHHCARADTLEGKIRVWHLKFEREMPNYKMFGNRKQNSSREAQHKKPKRQKPSWPADRPDFLQFVLYKENLDTSTATKELSRRGSKARIGFAGMKDKRGITTQFCTLYRTEPQHILSQRLQQSYAGGGGNTKQKGYSVVQVGNFEYVEKEMRLGTLKGNRFDLILRNVQTQQGDSGDNDAIVVKQALQDSAKAMKEQGFINYFGTQRFGKYQSTHLTGIAVLQGDFGKAIEILMEPKPDDRPDAAKGRKDWEERFQSKNEKDGNTTNKAEQEAASAKRVIRSLNRFMTAENSVMQSLSRKPLDYKKAFSCIPKTLRMMFLHAVQSLVWNRAASYRIASMDRKTVLVGDLVAVVPNNDRESTTRIVTEDDIANNKFSLEDVVIPLIGSKSKYPTNELGDVMRKMFTDIGISIDMFKNYQDKDVHVAGDYRKLICRPNDFDFEIKEYYDPLQPLIQTDLMKLNDQDIDIRPKKDEEKLKVAMIVGFTLPSSCYATVALRELTKKPTSTDYQKDLKLE